MTDKRINKLKRKLQEARYRLLTREPELAAPLVEMLFVTNVDVRRMSTNGSCIYFDASWLEKLDDNSLDFALCHQLMHIRLGHLSRPQFYKGDRFHFACNIVVNSSLIRYDFTDDKLPGIGEIHHETFYPKVEGCELTPYEAFQMTPLDPSTLSDAQRRNLLLDSDEWWDRPNARTEDGVLILSPDDPDPDDLIPSERIRGIIERVCKGFRKQEMPEVYRPEADDDTNWTISSSSIQHARVRISKRQFGKSGVQRTAMQKTMTAAPFVSASFTDRKSRLTIGNLS